MVQTEDTDKENPEIAQEFTVPEILESFRVYDGVYKRDQIDAAIKLKDEITPHLIKILEGVRADPQKYIEDDSLFEQIYAVMLLGHFKEPKAHKVIIDLFSLPGDMPDQIFGDIIASDLPAILLNTCDGSVDLIKSVILNKEANDYCRISACRALAYAAVEGYTSRESVMEFFGTLFTGEEADETSDFWGPLACVVCDVYPEELMEVIKQAYADELVMPGMIHYGAFEEALEMGKEKCLEKMKDELERSRLDNIHDAMSWWASFAETSPSSNREEDVFHNASGHFAGGAKKKKKKAKKKKRKQAKASKRKNR